MSDPRKEQNISELMDELMLQQDLTDAMNFEQGDEYDEIEED